MALNKSTGRDVWALLFDETTELVGDGSTVKTTKGHLYAITAIASTSSALPSGLVKGQTFYSQSAITLGSGDKVIDLGSPFDDDLLIGYARSKDITRSKNVVNVTVDADEFDDNRVDPIVAVSGNINGYKVNNLPATSASRKIDAMFGDQVIEAADGTVTTMDKNDKICLMGLVYIKELRANNEFEIDIVPCIFTSNGDSTDYGSATSKSVAFTGCAESEKGVKPCTLSVTVASV